MLWDSAPLCSLATTSVNLGSSGKIIGSDDYETSFNFRRTVISVWHTRPSYRVRIILFYLMFVHLFICFYIFVLPIEWIVFSVCMLGEGVEVNLSVSLYCSGSYFLYKNIFLHCFKILCNEFGLYSPQLLPLLSSRAAHAPTPSQLCKLFF